jgi:glucose/arabinose dehydrogenase
VSPGIKECQSAADLPGDGSPLTGVHPSFSLTNLRPAAFQPDVSGIAWYPDGSAAVLTWGAAQTSSNGKLYKVTNLQGDTSAANVTFTEVASGLAEPQGVAVVDGATYVSTKTGLDKLVDADGDGFFEGRDRLTSWPYANTFHEFAFGLPYRDGYFYVALASALDRAGVTLVPQPSAERGTIAKVNKDTGAVQYIAGGLRTPNGINWGPNGKLLVTDNQGGWVPTSKLVQIEEGGFYNTPTTWTDPVTGATVNGRFDNQPVTPPVVWMPHGEISNSPSTPVVMEEGLFAGQLAIGDVTYGGVQRVFLEQVDGKLQGALYRMTQGLEAGINELALGPDGDLYLGGIGYSGNWGQPGKLRYGLQKLRANDTVTMDILKTEITETGFKLTYTKPLSEATRANLAAKYHVQQWRYNPTAAYGGPKLDQEDLAVEGATVSADGKTVSISVAGVKPGRVVHIRSPRPFSAADGEQLWSTEVWYTANAVPGYQSPAEQGYYEGEEATIVGGATIASDHSKYSGSGFVANMTTVGSGVTFTVNAAQAGPQPVHVRYSNGPNPSVKTKLVSLIVNGTEVDPLALPSTTDWKTWAFATRELNLNAGTNTITIRYDTGDDGWVNVDLLKVGAERDICSPQAPGTGYTSLFDGTLDSLTGWRHASGGSFARLADCSIKTVGDIGMLWWPGERFDNYSLKLDWKLAGDDNSGIFVGFPDPGNDWNVAFTRGHEVQIDATDDADSTTGAIYNYSAPDAVARDAALNPPGQWNAYEIIVEGQRIQVFLNGAKVNDYTNTDPNRMTVPGFIGIQNHGVGDDVFFRNIRLKKLDQGANAAPVIDTATATPASGPAPLAVSFAATATDPDGDAVTYAWDLDGDGTFETNGRTPSRTYDTPRLYAPAVRVTDPDGASATRTLAVTVQPATTKTEAPGSVSATVPGVLALSFGASANLGAFMPGVDRDYTASLSGTVTSSESTAALTVHDPSATATGRLINGPWSLPQPLQMRSGSGAFAPLSSSGTPLPLAQFTTPVGLQPITIEVKQPIAAIDSLRAGEYGKTLTFTLTATTP